MSVVFIVIAVVAAFVAMYARSQVDSATQDPYVRYWLAVVDSGKSYEVTSESLQIVANDSAEVQAYLSARPHIHDYYKNGSPDYSLEKKNRYKALLTINGEPATVYSQPFVNNEAGMKMNLEGHKKVEMYIAPSGEVHFLL